MTSLQGNNTSLSQTNSPKLLTWGLRLGLIAYNITAIVFFYSKGITDYYAVDLKSGMLFSATISVFDIFLVTPVTKIKRWRFDFLFCLVLWGLAFFAGAGLILKTTGPLWGILIVSLHSTVAALLIKQKIKVLS